RPARRPNPRSPSASGHVWLTLQPLAICLRLRFPCAIVGGDMAPTKTASPLFARNPERVRRALRELDGGELLPALGAQLERALEGSDEATREYVRCYHVLTLRVLDEAHRTRPDVVVRTADGHLALIDVKGTLRRGPVEALE